MSIKNFLSNLFGCKACAANAERVKYLETLVDRLLEAKGARAVHVPVPEKESDEDRERRERIENGDVVQYGGD